MMEQKQRVHAWHLIEPVLMRSPVMPALSGSAVGLSRLISISTPGLQAGPDARGAKSEHLAASRLC
jgi:hypothetical protein